MSFFSSWKSISAEARADPDSCGPAGVPPLARAAAQGNAKTLRLLLDHGASRGTRLPLLRAASLPRLA